MAERRMFAKSVINSARFLTMPPSSRLLYYDLGMAADDDGVVEAFIIEVELQGSKEDDAPSEPNAESRGLNDE